MPLLRYVISGPFRVLNSEGETVGVVGIGGAEIILPSGIYRVDTNAPNPKAIRSPTKRDFDESDEMTR